jgi:hypothetical protein
LFRLRFRGFIKMIRYVAFLLEINVGGKKLIKMEDRAFGDIHVAPGRLWIAGRWLPGLVRSSRANIDLTARRHARLLSESL